MEQTDRSVHSGYPLSALFVLLAACAVVSALLAPVARALVAKVVTVEQVAVTSFVGLLLVGLVGGVIGLYHYRPLRGVGWGVLTGGIIGALIGRYGCRKWFGDKWPQYRIVFAAGFGAGMGLAAMFALGVVFMLKSVNMVLPL